MTLVLRARPRSLPVQQNLTEVDDQTGAAPPENLDPFLLDRWRSAAHVGDGRHRPTRVLEADDQVVAQKTFSGARADGVRGDGVLADESGTGVHEMTDLADQTAA